MVLSRYSSFGSRTSLAAPEELNESGRQTGNVGFSRALATRLAATALTTQSRRRVNDRTYLRGVAARAARTFGERLV